MKEQVSQEKNLRTEIRQLVCFRLGDENFGLDIYKVHDINRRVDITKIPKSPKFVEGVINLRGNIVPVIDLRKRFEMPKLESHTKENRIVVIENNGQTVGLAVDAVTEVLRIPVDAIEPTPDMVKSEVDSRYIEGITKLSDSRLLIVLDTDKIFSDDEKKLIAATAKE